MISDNSRQVSKDQGAERGDRVQYGISRSKWEHMSAVLGSKTAPHAPKLRGVPKFR